MLWIFVSFQLLFDLIVVVFLLVYLFRRQEENISVAPPVWQEELFSTLEQLLDALNDRLPQRASTLAAMHAREEQTGAKREHGILPGERLLISSLAEKRNALEKSVR